jgi:hypothetical protein
MKERDVFYCKLCDLELTVRKASTCEAGVEDACGVTLQGCIIKFLSGIHSERINTYYNQDKVPPGRAAGSVLLCCQANYLFHIDHSIHKRYQRAESFT